MGFDRTCEILHLEVAPEVADACRFLEERGLRFCVDFGTDNAQRLAGEWICAYEDIEEPDEDDDDFDPDEQEDEEDPEDDDEEDEGR